MIKLHATGALDAVELGQFVEFRIDKSDPDIETRFFLHHRPVLYPRPVRDWTTDPSLTFFPEAPGAYTLAAEWRSPGGGVGWQQIDFEVAGPRSAGPEPRKVGLDAKTTIWIPNGWEAYAFKKAEKAPIERLESLIQSGSAVYDVGANVGVYAARMARRVGPEGRLVCIEANPVCVQYLRTNILKAKLGNVDILPVALLHKNGTTRFSVNYGNSTTGLSEVSGYYGLKVGHEVVVPSYTFDQLLVTYDLPAPDVVKLDVEGAEHLAVLGMRRTLEQHRPILLIELHGEPCTGSTLQELDRHGYRYRDPDTGQDFADAEQVQARFESSVFQLLALPD